MRATHLLAAVRRQHVGPWRPCHPQWERSCWRAALVLILIQLLRAVLRVQVQALTIHVEGAVTPQILLPLEEDRVGMAGAALEQSREAGGPPQPGTPLPWSPPWNELYLNISITVLCFNTLVFS